MIDIICILNFPTTKQGHWYSNRKYTLKKNLAIFLLVVVSLFVSPSSLPCLFFFFCNNLEQF